MCRIIKTEFYKIVTGYGLYLCVLFTVILCFGTGIHSDMTTNNEYSIMRSLTSFDREYMLSSTDFSSISVALKGAGSWLTMFIPIISSFAFIPLVCDESESKSIRNALFRSSKIKFYLSKFITATLSGGLAIMIGYMLFSGIVFILFPNIREYPPETFEIYQKTLSLSYTSISDYGLTSALLIKHVEMFIYGAVAAIPSIMLTAISKNKYIVMCIPFFFKYALTQTCAKLSAQAYSSFDNTNEGLIKFSNTINPDSVLNIFEIANRELIIIYHIVIIVIALTFYLFIQLRRLDCGE